MLAAISLGNGVVDLGVDLLHAGKFAVGIELNVNDACGAVHHRPDKLTVGHGGVGGKGEANVGFLCLFAGFDGQGTAADLLFHLGGAGLHRVDGDHDLVAAGLGAVQLALGGAGAQDKVTVGIHHRPGGRVDVQHTGLGVVDVAVGVHHLEEALAGDGAVQGEAGAGHGGRIHHQVDAGQLGAIAHGGGVDTAPGLGTGGGPPELLVVHIPEGGPPGFEAVGVGVCDVVADNVHPVLIGLHASHTGVHGSNHILIYSLLEPFFILKVSTPDLSVVQGPCDLLGELGGSLRSSLLWILFTG